MALSSAIRCIGYSITVALPLAAPSAFAADLPARTAPAAVVSPIPIVDWSGPYAGAFFGGGLGQFSTSQGAVGADSSGFGLSSGVLAGYNWQSGALVYGFETDFGYNLTRARFSARPGFAANQAESIYLVEARARLGYDFGQFMPYVAGGLVYSRLDQSQQAPFEFYGQTRNRTGWTIGAGVDAKVFLPILGASVLRGEYVYEGLPNASFDLIGPMMSTRLSTQYVRLALISRIGEDWRPSTIPSAGDWSDGYFGVIGAAEGNNISTKGAGGSASFSAKGGAGGVYAGRNWMYGAAMLGVDGATMLANVSGDGAQPGAASTSYRDFLAGDFRARAGYAFGRFLPYAALGLAFDNAEESDSAKGQRQGNIAFISGEAGVGLDYMASERIALRAEYDYAQTLTAISTHLSSETCCKQTRANNSVRLGVAYFFH